MDEERKKMIGECYSCLNRRDIRGDCHSKCAKPDAEMTGSEHGRRNGWFMYPYNFDPVWKTKICNNYESKNAVSEPVSSVGESK